MSDKAGTQDINTKMLSDAVTMQCIGNHLSHQQQHQQQCHGVNSFLPRHAAFDDILSL